MTTKIQNPAQGCMFSLFVLVVVVVVANLPYRCFSFQVTVPPSRTTSSIALDRCRDANANNNAYCYPVVTTSSSLKSTTEEEQEQLVAAVEDGTIDIEALEEMFGEEFDFDGDDEDEDHDVEVDDNLVEDDDDEEEMEYEEYDEDEEEEEEEEVGNETELLVQFVEHCRETPIGELDLGDVELIREIMGNFPLDASDEDVEEKGEDDAKSSTKASYVVESLLHRIVDEWRDAVLLLESDDENDEDDESNDIPIEERQEREQIFRPVAGDFYKAMVAVWKDEQNNDSPDTKADRIWKIFSEQRELISFFDDVPLAAESLYPNIRTIELVMKSMAMSRDRGVDRKASMIVKNFLPEYGLIPSPEVYGPYIQMVGKARSNGAARKAESILRQAVKEYPPNDYESPIGVDIFNTVVTAYAKARGEADGPTRAQDLIVFMDGLGKPGCAPNARTFTSLVDAYAQTNDWDSVTEAQGILNNLLNQYLLQEGEGKYLEPSVATWTIVIAAWMRLSKKGRNGAAKRAGDLLRRMDSLSSAGRINAKPDAITYVTAFNAYAHSKFSDEVEEAERILEEMNEVYLDGDDSFKPSVRSIRALLDAWIKVGAMDKAENVLDQYEDILEEAENNDDGSDSRHTMSADDWKDIYKSLLVGYTRLENPKRATGYLNIMIENDGMEPESMCYDRIIETYVRLGEADCAKKSQGIFELLEKRRQAGAVQPNERVFTSFIRALTKSKAPGLHKKADLILQRMNSLVEGGNSDAKPTIFTYNAVLNACAECVTIDGTPMQEAFQTSVRVFTELRKDMDPDHVTYGNIIRCANLLPSASHQQTKDKFIAATFKLCCESGNVNNYLIRDLSRVASKDLWTSLTGFSTASDEQVEIDIEDATMLLEKLPASWKRQMKDRQQKPPSNANSSRKTNNYR